MSIREASKDIAWRADVMDNVIEAQLPQLYFEWVKELRIAAEDEERGSMEEFWLKLMMDIKMQMEEISEERSGIEERHGNYGNDRQKVIDTVTEIGGEIDTTGNSSKLSFEVR